MADRLNMIIGDEDSQATAQLKDICSSVPGLSIAGVAHSEKLLLAKLNQSGIDLVLLGLSNKMGGLEILDKVKQVAPDVDIIVLYEPESLGSDDLVDALESGATECIEKTAGTDTRRNNEFRLRLMAITGLLRSRKRFAKSHSGRYKSRFFMPAEAGEKPKESISRIPKGRIDVVAIASSTGGPEILSRIFSILPGNLNVPILLVQHIPEKITRHFARSLNKKSELEIHQARHGEQVLSRRVYMAPGGQHMMISVPDAKGRRNIILTADAPVNSVRPSADLLFESVARSYNGNILAVVLTGMGEDGKKGVAAMKEKGCFCITQKAETCVVYGMPRAIDEAGLSNESLDPLSITQRIVMMVQ